MMSIEVKTVSYEQGTGPIYAVTREYCVEATPKWGLYATEYLRDDGTWAKDRDDATTFDTPEEAAALAMGLGAMPMSLKFEEESIAKAEELLEIASRCVKLKAFPHIERLIRAGKRDEAIKFTAVVPGRMMQALAVAHAEHYDPEAV